MTIWPHIKRLFEKTDKIKDFNPEKLANKKNIHIGVDIGNGKSMPQMAIYGVAGTCLFIGTPEECEEYMRENFRNNGNK